MTVDHDVFPEENRASSREVPTRVLLGWAAAGVALLGWFLFGLLGQRQGLVASVGESAGAGFALLLAVSVVATIRHNAD